MAKPEEFKFEVNKEYSFPVAGFRYMSGWAFIVVKTEVGNQSILIGEKAHFPMSEMMCLKGNSVDITYEGVKNVNGKDYNRFTLDCISF